MSLEVRNLPQDQAVTTADATMLRILSLHSEGFTVAEACDIVGVEAGYWTKHRQTLLAALGAVTVAQAVRRALERKLFAPERSA